MWLVGLDFTYVLKLNCVVCYNIVYKHLHKKEGRLWIAQDDTAYYSKAKQVGRGSSSGTSEEVTCAKRKLSLV